MFQMFFYQPVLNLLVFLYNIVPGHDLGIVIILLTVVIKLVLYPLSNQSIKSQKALQDLQPKIDELKKKYANNKEEMGKAMMALYKENKVNPLSSCLPLLIQLPFLIAVFQVFQKGLSNGSLSLVYSFIERPDFINPISLGFIDLSKKSLILAILSGAAQFWQAKMMPTQRPAVHGDGAKDEDMMTMMNKQMMYIMPLMTIFIGATLPGGLTFYWFLTTMLTIAQQQYILKKDKNNKIIEGEVVKQ